MGSIFCIISFFILLSITFGAQFDSHNEKCNLYPERGTCHHAFQMKWYYHPFTGKCKKFFYSGCDGNDNRFETEQECLSQCTFGRTGIEIEDYKRCHEPYDKGDCWGDFERWYFDSDKGECICTSYSGCGGSGNKFYSFNHCMEVCGDFSKNNYQKSYYDRSEHGQMKRQRLQNYNQKLSGKQDYGNTDLQNQQYQPYEEQTYQGDPRYYEKYEEELRQRQQPGPEEDPRYHEKYEEELRQRQQPGPEEDPRQREKYEQELRERQQVSNEQDPRYIQQQKEYEERLQEYYRQREEYFKQQGNKKKMDEDSENERLHKNSRPVSLSEDLSYGNTLTVEDVMPHDPHPWHQVEPQFPTRRRWIRRFNKRSNKNHLKEEDKIKKRKTRSTYQSNQVNYNYKGSAYSSYYDSRDYLRKHWENDRYPIKDGTMENFIAYAPFRRYNRLTTIEKNEPLQNSFDTNFLRDQPLGHDSDYEPIDTQEITNFKLPTHLTHLPLSEKKKYWKKIVNRRYEEAKKLRSQRIKAVSMYTKFLENDLRRKMRGKIRVHYIPQYKYYLIRREEYPENVNNLETTMQAFGENNNDQSYYNQYITTTEVPLTTVQSDEITTKPPTTTISTPPTTPRIYTTPTTTTSSTTTATPTLRPTGTLWNYYSKKPLDIESTVNEFTSHYNTRSQKPTIQFPPITQIIDLDDYQPFDNNSQEDSDFDDLITPTPQPKEVPTVIVTSITTTTKTPIIDDPIQIVFPTKKPIKNSWTFDDDDDDDVFFFKTEAKKKNQQN